MLRTIFALAIDGVATWTARIGDDCASETLAANSEMLIASSSGIHRVMLMEYAAAV